MGDSNNPYTTLSDATQPQSQNRTLRNGSASDRKGPTPRKDEHTGNNAVTNAIPRIVESVVLLVVVVWVFAYHLFELARLSLQLNLFLHLAVHQSRPALCGEIR